MRTIGDVAELAGVSIRTLRHYDEIGLLVPSGRTDAGYRLYDGDELERLQEILVWRQLGFPLAEIQRMLDAPDHDRISAIRRQRALAQRERARLAAVIQALDAALAAHENGTDPEETTMFEGFDHECYEAEARDRWGHTDAFAESTRRAAQYDESDWRTIRAEGDEIISAFARLLKDGVPATGEEARAAAERHRQHISQWFYPCSPDMHRALGEMYLADERFTRTYEQVATGLARYVRDAISASAATRRNRSRGGLISAAT
jgi:DNA-binding transcriptional MerR regulator